MKSALCFCDATGIIKNETEELKRLSQKSSRNVSNPFTVAVEVYIGTGGLFS